MTRVTENTSFGIVKDSIHRSKARMEKFQKQNATLKRLNKPSDNPIGNTKLMSIRNETLENERFIQNANYAKTFLNYTDSALEEVSNALVRAKELAIQASSSATSSAEARLMTAEEIKHLQGQIYSIANRKLGNRYIFAGYQTSNQPFDSNGSYKGDEGKIMVEIGRDLFISMNIPGNQVFSRPVKKVNPEGLPDPLQQPMNGVEGMAEEDIFRSLETLRVGLMTNNTDMIHSTLDPLEALRSRVVATRAMVGSRVHGIEASESSMARRGLFNAELKSNIEDADVLDVVSNIAKEEVALKASLRASAKIVQPTLLEFLR